jgi:hypothetical protein
MRRQLAVVPVILAMAGDAGCSELVAIEIAGVAGVALHLGVGAPEGKFRVLVMVESDRRPLVLVVAGLTPGAVAPAMNILNLVAAGAGHADFLVALADMARRAGDVAVGAPQRKLRPVVIVGLDAPPRGFAVTAVARLAEPPLVRVAGLMAVEAPPSRRVAEFRVLRVTSAAGHRLVGLPQFEVRQGVVERLAVKQDDVRIAPLVIGMALRAFLLRRVGLAAVKPLGRQPVGGNVLVAGQA